MNIKTNYQSQNITGGNTSGVYTGTWTTGGIYPGSMIKPKGWTKMICHKCNKELGFVKDLWDTADEYYCEDCRLLEKLKE